MRWTIPSQDSSVGPDRARGRSFGGERVGFRYRSSLERARPGRFAVAGYQHAGRRIAIGFVHEPPHVAPNDSTSVIRTGLHDRRHRRRVYGSRPRRQPRVLVASVAGDRNEHMVSRGARSARMASQAAMERTSDSGYRREGAGLTTCATRPIWKSKVSSTRPAIRLRVQSTSSPRLSSISAPSCRKKWRSTLLRRTWPGFPSARCQASMKSTPVDSPWCTSPTAGSFQLPCHAISTQTSSAPSISPSPCCRVRSGWY